MALEKQCQLSFDNNSIYVMLTFVCLSQHSLGLIIDISHMLVYHKQNAHICFMKQILKPFCHIKN